MVKLSNSRFPILEVILIFFLVCASTIQCLYQDQVGKFDWRKQFIGIPKYVYSHPGTGNLILGTESNVIASLNERDGTILWRQLLPKDCHLDHVSILKSNDDHLEYLIRTSCSDETGKLSQIWNPNNGLVASEVTYKSIADDETAESVLADQGHFVDGRKVFTLSDDSSVVVKEDGQVVLNSRGEPIWTREESLASVIAAEIVRLPTDMRDKFGMKKMIILLTNKGKIFGMDTITGESVWTLFEPNISVKSGESTSTLVITRQSDDSESESRAVIIHSSGLIVDINPISGELLAKKQLPYSIKQIAFSEIFPELNLRGVILLDVQDKVHIYPESLADVVKRNIRQYYMTIVDKSPVVLKGYEFVIESSDIVPKQKWNLSFNNTEKVISLGIKRIDEQTHSPARVLGDRNILYKYINPNLVALMTQSTTGDACSPETSVNIYLIDGVTGALVHNVHHPKSRGPSNMVHSENWLVYTYYSTKNRRTEVSSLEMFEGSVQTNSTIFSSLTRSHIKPKLIEFKTFIFPSGVDAMVDTVTLRGMTNRHIIMALPSGGLLEVPKIFLDPRRPINMLMEHREEGLIPYMPELPIPSESMINYDQTLMAVRKIITSPADLESTSLVFAYGLDLFFTRVTPSKTFDILKDDFDHVLIAGVLVFLVVASYISKLLAQRKALHAAWK